jgi:hypothetical protein
MEKIYPFQVKMLWEEHVQKFETFEAQKARGNLICQIQSNTHRKVVRSRERWWMEC